MNIFQDMLFINKTAFTKAGKLFLKNWPIIFTGFVYSILSLVLYSLIGILFRGILSFFAGIVIFIAMSAMISNYLYLLYNVIKHNRITLNDFREGFKVYLWKIYGVLFVGWLASYIFDMIITPILYSITSSTAVTYISTLLVLILLNPLPEAVYQKHYSSWETILYAFNFIRENWIEWFIPNSILILALYLATGTFISNVFAFQIGFNFNLSPMGIALYVVGQVLFSFTMIYRGVLFEILSTSTRRKRMFMRNIYK